MMAALPASAEISSDLSASIQAAVSSGNTAELQTILDDNSADAGEIAQLIVSFARSTTNTEAASAAIATALSTAQSLAATQPTLAASIARVAMAVIDTGSFRVAAARQNPAVAANLLAASASAAQIAATPEVQVSSPVEALTIAGSASTVASSPAVANSDPAKAVAVVAEVAAVAQSEQIVNNVPRPIVLRVNASLNRASTALQNNPVVTNAVPDLGDQLAGVGTGGVNLPGQIIVPRPEPTPTPYQS